MHVLPYIDFPQKCRQEENGLRELRPDCHSLYFWYPKMFVTACMSFGTHAWLLQRLYHNCKATATSLSIRLFINKGRSNSKSDQGWYEVAEYVVFTGLIRKARRPAMLISWLGWTDKETGVSDQPMMPGEFADSVKEKLSAEEIYVFTPDEPSVPSKRSVTDWLCLWNPCWEKDGCHTAARNLWQPNSRQGIRIVTNSPWLPAVTGSIWPRPARRTRFAVFKNQDKELFVNKGREMLIPIKKWLCGLINLSATSATWIK